jgi:hypothetical protein
MEPSDGRFRGSSGLTAADAGACLEVRIPDIASLVRATILLNVNKFTQDQAAMC